MLLMGYHTRLRCYKRVRFVDVVIVVHSFVTYCFVTYGKGGVK